MIYTQTKTLNTNFNAHLESTHQQKKIIGHSKKLNDKVGLEKVQEKGWQYFIEKVIDHIENPNSYNYFNEKEAQIFSQIETNYKICRRVYGMLYYDIAENFKSYLESLDFDEIQVLNLNIKANGGGLLPIENYSDSTELLKEIALFYYINGRFPFTTGLLTIPDVEAPSFVNNKKISIKKLYERSRGTYSQDLVAVPFLSALNLFFVGNNQT